MMPDEAATLARFDDVLDGLVEGRGMDADGLDPALVETFDRLRSATSDITPDPVFAGGLRRSLLQRTEVAPVRTDAGAPLRLTLAPAARWFPSGRWWPRFELAAMVLVIGLLTSVIAGGDVWRRLPAGSDDGGFVVAPGTPTNSMTPSPTATVAAATLIPEGATIAPAASVSAVPDDPRSGDIVVSTDDDVNLRAAPSTNSEVVMVLSRDQPLRITGDSVEQGGFVWLPVTDVETDMAGWVVADWVTPRPPDQSTPVPAGFELGDVVAVTVDGVNLRSEPRVEDNIIERLSAGSRLVITHDPIRDGMITWLPVQDVKAGTRGYVNSGWGIARATPPSTPTATATPSGRQHHYEVGEEVRVATSDAPLRASPSLDSAVLQRPSRHTRLIVVGAPVEDGTLVWWPVRVAETGDSGYVLDFFLESPSEETSPTVTVLPTVTPVDADADVATTSSATRSPVPSTRFAVGATVYVAQPRVALREGPSFEARTVAMPMEGMPLTIIGPSQEAEGVVWWPVGDPATGNAGFVVEAGLSAELPAPTATPNPVVDSGYVDPGNKVEVSVSIDAAGLVDGDPVAKAEAVEQLREALAPYEGCLVGFVLTFAWSSDLSQGIATANAINRLLQEAFPEMFGHAAFESFANLRDPAGQVDLDLYFYRGCTPGSTQASVPTGTPTPVPSKIAGSPVAEQTPGAVLFLIDRSGSMSYDPLGGTAKLEMEKETIRRAVAALPVGTTIGVIAFNEGQEWAVPWTTIRAVSNEADRRAIVLAVDAITAEGGSEMPAALTAAIYHMRANVDTAAKHIVLLSDGKWRGGGEQFYRDAVGGAVQEGFVLSTIAFGNDADTLTMQLLAEVGNGLYHLVEQPEDIPTLLMQDGELVVDESV